MLLLMVMVMVVAEAVVTMAAAVAEGGSGSSGGYCHDNIGGGRLQWATERRYSGSGNNDRSSTCNGSGRGGSSRGKRRDDIHFIIILI